MQILHEENFKILLKKQKQSYKGKGTVFSWTERLSILKDANLSSFINIIRSQ